MPDWTVDEDYEFPDSKSRWRWVWEFMRRNAEYQADFKESVAGGTWHDPPLNKGETVKEWQLRVMQGNVEPVSMPLAHAKALKWKINQPMQDPADDSVPLFTARPPYLVRADDFDGNFEQSDADGDAVGPWLQKEEVAVLAFSMLDSIDWQVKRAEEIIKDRHKQFGGPRAAKRYFEYWRLYCRLLDAKAVGATTNEILSTLAAYKHKVKTPDSGPNKVLSDNLIRAKELQAQPLSILD